MKLKHNSINYSVDTVDALLTLVGEENDVVVVTDENRGGTFVYKSAEAGANNGGTIFNGWTRQYDGAVNVKWFGAVGDGITPESIRWNSNTNYSTGQLVQGSDFLTYRATQNSGPDNGGSLDPLTDSGWILYYLPVDYNLSITVGATGDYSTINEAIEYLSRLAPIAISGGLTATITLQAGFVMQEQLLINGLDLGWITITGEDAETTIENAYLTTDFATTDFGFISHCAFGVKKGGTLPFMEQLFSFDAHGDTTKDGCLVVGAGSSSSWKAGSGIKNAGGNGFYAYGGALGNINSTFFNTAGSNGVVASNCSNVSAAGVNATSCTSYGVSATFGSTLNANYANCDNCTSFGINAYQASTVTAVYATANNCSRGFSATYASTIDAKDTVASGCSNAYYASENSRINATGSTALNCTSDAVFSAFGSTISADSVNTTGHTGFGFRVSIGSTITAYLGVGTLSLTKNTLSVHGTIYTL